MRLRRSCSVPLALGVPPRTVMEIVGHSSPTVTKTIYIDATRKIQREAVDRLGFLFDE